VGDSAALEETMKHYDVYQGCEAVKRGFSWPAFFFSWIWAISRRLWLQAIVIFVALLGMWVISTMLREQGSTLPAHLANLASIGVFVVAGVYGNRWRSAELARRGYILEVTKGLQGPVSEILSCTSCGAQYRTGDYRENAEVWYCSSCNNPLPKKS